MALEKKKARALRLNLITLSIARHWLRIMLIILGVYIALPFIAPTLMKLGLEGPGRAIYFVYSPFCHQFAFRSFFLYGEQTTYPRYSTGSGTGSFESYVVRLPEFAPDRVVSPMLGKIGDIYGFSPAFQIAAREFVGNEQMGYKVSLCERDISIYPAMFVGGLIFTRLRRRLRPAPVWLYALLGLGPIGLDGFSQLLGYPPFNLWPPRETLPIFRVVTGALFGLMNVWLGLPYVEMSMRETRREIEAKLARAGIKV